jgi:segregation and condensation protein B
MSPLASTLQAFLFTEGSAMRKSRLSQLAGVSEAELSPALAELENHLRGSGLSLIRTETEVALAMTRETSDKVLAAQKKELGDEIGNAGLEVLAIVLYRGASTRAHIDFVRGASSSTTVRNLLSRGLLERAGNPLDGREYLYRPTTEALAYLGLSSCEDLPEYKRMVTELTSFEKNTDPFSEKVTETIRDDAREH